MSEKRRTHREALLALMQDGQWHHMAAMRQVAGWRYGARLHELKRAGWAHDKRGLGENEFEYRLYAMEPAQLALTI